MSRPKFLFSAILTMLVPLLVPIILPSVPRVYGVNRSLTLVGFVQAWNNTSTNRNPTITVGFGDQVSITLKPGDLSVHRFFIDVANYGPAPICPPDKCSAPFSDPNTIIYTFTVDFPVGKYTYYCSVHPTTMFGSFVLPFSDPWSNSGRGPLKT